MRVDPPPPLVQLHENSFLELMHGIKDAADVISEAKEVLRPKNANDMERFSAYLKLCHTQGRLEGTAEALNFYLPLDHVH